MRTGRPREFYPVPLRQNLNNWPPATASLQALYAAWVWGRNSGDFSYASQHWSEARALFNARQGSIRYYADIGGLIGYYRLANALGDSAARAEAETATLQALSGGLNFTAFRQRAENDYPDPRLRTRRPAGTFRSSSA